MRLTAAVVLVVALAHPGGLAAEPLDIEIARYLAAGDSAAVEGRAYQERRLPEAPDAPLSDTRVVLVPRSAALVERLARIKTGARDSLPAYREAAAALRREHEAFVLALRESGAATLVRSVEVDGTGRFTLDRVPEGPWLLVAWRSVFVARPSTQVPRKDRDRYVLAAPLEGYRAVSLWLRDVDLRPGDRAAVELTDRNVWFSGVEEVRRGGAGR